MAYFDELKKAMNWLSAYKDVIFVGQAVSVPGTAMYNTLKDTPESSRIELPVFEDTQMGMSLGLSFTGLRVVSVFPRWNFLICAANQLINHVDKYKLMSDGSIAPSLIIRTSVGSQRPLFPGHQHIADFSGPFKLMLENTDVHLLEEPDQIFPAYKHAYERTDGRSTILVEIGDYYNEK